MIQDIAPHIYRNEYKPQRPAKNSYVMYFEEGKLLARIVDEEIQYPTFEEVEKANSNIYEEAIYLFTIDEMRFYLVEKLACSRKFETWVKEKGKAENKISLEMKERGTLCGKEETLAWLGKEDFRNAQPLHLAFAGITAYQLKQWYQSHQFCGRCGKSMKRDEKERMMFCEACHQVEYPKICPAVIVGVTDGNRLLLTKYAGRKFKKYALVAGFAEIGETIEDTVRREVMEEVGLKVKNVTYYKSQPWSFTDTLLFGFYCEVDGSSEIVLDENELSVATWFEREEIPVTEKTVSLTNEMILNFKYGKNEE